MRSHKRMDPDLENVTRQALADAAVQLRRPEVRLDEQDEISTRLLASALAAVSRPLRRAPPENQAFPG